MEKVSQEEEKLSQDKVRDIAYVVANDVVKRTPILFGKPIQECLNELYARNATSGAEEVNNLKQTVASLATKVAAIEMDTQSQIRALRQEVEDYANENGVMARQIDKLKDDSTYTNAKMKELSKEIKRLKERLGEAEKENKRISDAYNDIALRLANWTSRNIHSSFVQWGADPTLTNPYTIDPGYLVDDSTRATLDCLVKEVTNQPHKHKTGGDVREEQL